MTTHPLTSRTLRVLLLSFASLVVTSSACSQAQCLRQSDCPPPSVCRAGRCKLPPKPWDYDASATVDPEATVPEATAPETTVPVPSATGTVTPVGTGDAGF